MSWQPAKRAKACSRRRKPAVDVVSEFQAPEGGDGGAASEGAFAPVGGLRIGAVLSAGSRLRLHASAPSELRHEAPVNRMGFAWVLSAILACLLAGCREQSDNQSEKPETPPVVAESADQLAARAQAAMDRREFAQAGELYSRATSAPDSPDNPSSADQRFDWRCKAALGWWLAGRLDKAKEMSPQGETLPIVKAMNAYVNAEWPTDDCDRMLDVIPMAAAMEIDTELDWDSFDRVIMTWPQVARLPTILSAWAAMDGGRLTLGSTRVVATILSANKMPATFPDSDSAPFAGNRLANTPYFEDSGMELECAFLQTPVVRGDAAQLIGDWISVVGRHSDRWPSGYCRLGIAARDSQHHGYSCRLIIDKKPGLVSFRGRGPARPTPALPAALSLIDSATPEGATPVASRAQAEMVVSTMNRTTGRPEGRTDLARIQPQDNYFWVMPGPQAKAADAALIPLAAGWLAYHDWKLPSGPAASTQPAGSQPDDPADLNTPADPTEP